MSRAGISKGARSRLDALARSRPEMAPWLDVLEVALAAISDPGWRGGLGELVAAAEGGAPRLVRATLRARPKAAEDLVRELIDRAARGSTAGGPLAGASLAGGLDCMALLEASVNQDAPRLLALSAAMGAREEAIAPLAAAGSMPLLHACREALGMPGGSPWDRGYCPICAAWPALAELRGLERARVLRCARCGAGWVFEPLVCVYCGERDHERLGALMPEAHGEARKVDVCNACGGYLKAASTLAALPADAVAVEDAATVDLDLAAIERGYGRPDAPAVELCVRLAPP